MHTVFKSLHEIIWRGKWGKEEFDASAWCFCGAEDSLQHLTLAGAMLLLCLFSFSVGGCNLLPFISPWALKKRVEECSVLSTPWPFFLAVFCEVCSSNILFLMCWPQNQRSWAITLVSRLVLPPHSPDSFSFLPAGDVCTQKCLAHQVCWQVSFRRLERWN